MGKKRIGLKILYVVSGIAITIVIVVGLLGLGNYAYHFSYDIFNEQAVSKSPGKDAVVTVNKGMSSFEIGKVMKEKGLTDNSLLFAAQMKMSDYGAKVQPGTYQLNSSMTPTQMLKIMARVEEETEN